MKKFFMFIALFLGIPTFVLQAQQGWSVEIRIEDCVWRDGGQEWVCQLYADLELNGQFVPPSNDYYYFWEHTDVGDPLGCLSTTWQPGNGNGYGIFHIAPDDQVGECHRWRVTVSGVGPGGGPFQVTSPPVDVTKEGTPHKVDTRVKREDGSNLLGNIYLQHWMGHNWRQLGTSLSSYVYLTLDEFETLWTTTDLVLNPAEKYNHWNFEEENLLNYGSFFIFQNLDSITGNFKTIYTATIQTDFYGSSGGDVRFKDPWFPDDTELGGIPRNRGTGPIWYTHQSPLVIYPVEQNQYKGVFLDQDPAQNIPYYSIGVAAETTLTVNGKELLWYFERWSGSNANIVLSESNETPVVFTNNNATVTANLKGHLASNSATATASNNGRRVVVDEDRTWHLVYEDGGNIYYTASTDNGQSWSAETRLSSTASWGKNRSPSIAYHTGLLRLGVVWDREQGGVHFPVYRYKRTDYPWSGEIFAQSSDNVTSPENCKPVLIHAKLGGRPYNLGYVILCRVNSASKRGIGVLLGGNLMEEEENESLVWMDLVDQTTQYSDNPTVTAPHPLAPTIHVAWEENYRIFYSNYDGSAFDTIFEVSASSPEDTKSHPAICSIEEGQIDVVWQVYTETQQLLFQHRRRNANGVWGTIFQVALDGAGLTLPSAGAYREDENLITALQADAQTRFLYFYGSGWAFFDGQYPGNNPAMNDKGIDLMGVWNDASEGLPFRIENQFFEYIPTEQNGGEILPALANPSPAAHPGLFPGEDSTLAEKQYRKELFRLQELPGLNLEGRAALWFGDIQIRTPDSLRVWRFDPLAQGGSASRFLQTLPLTVGSEVQSAFLKARARVRDMRKTGTVPHLPLLRLRLIDHRNGEPLLSAREIALDSLNGSQFSWQDSLEIDLQPFSGREVVLQLQTIEHLLGSWKAQRIHIQEFYPKEREGILFTKNNLEQLQVSSMPQTFALHQNFPNPFNPETTIQFELPMNSAVSLKIYDLQGRLVKTLANREMPAGAHKIVWDGRDNGGALVSSGVYIYRMEAGNFVESHKMLLIH